MNEPKWKLINNDVVWRELPDGRQESCLVTSEQYLKWLEEGNTPLPMDEQ